MLQAHTEGDGCWASGAKVGWAVRSQREKMLLKILKEIRTSAEIAADIEYVRKLTRVLSAQGKFSKYIRISAEWWEKSVRGRGQGAAYRSCCFTVGCWDILIVMRGNYSQCSWQFKVQWS